MYVHTVGRVKIWKEMVIYTLYAAKYSTVHTYVCTHTHAHTRIYSTIFVFEYMFPSCVD